MAFNAASTIFGVSIPYFFINSSGVPLSPNLSFTPTISTGNGKFLLNNWQIESPNPPLNICSSAVTTALVFLAEFKIASASKGLIVWILIISAFMPFSAKICPASMAFQTKCPVANMETSFPSFNNNALPISNF